jgi:translation initiation factor IF-3
VRVIGSTGEQLGILTIEAALAKAAEAGLDLVEISPTAKPPVCKIMDYGKFKYDEKKRQAQAKKKQVVVQIKEVKLRPRTDEHDYDFKVRNVRRFLEEGNKAKLTIMFRGREIVHKEIGQKILMRVVDDLKGLAVVEQTPRMEGRQMFMIVAPDPKMKRPAPKAAKAEAAAPAPAPIGTVSAVAAATPVAAAHKE